jgi:hypothetical protein
MGGNNKKLKSGPAYETLLKKQKKVMNVVGTAFTFPVKCIPLIC